MHLGHLQALCPTSLATHLGCQAVPVLGCAFGAGFLVVVFFINQFLERSRAGSTIGQANA